MTQDFNHQQMSRLVRQYLDLPTDYDLPLTVVYVSVNSDYWVDQNRFVEDFTSVPLNHYIVIHVRFEGLSFTASGLRHAVETLISQQQRSNDKIFVFSPNNVTEDHTWVNLFYNGFGIITDEIIRARHYVVPSLPVDYQTAKTWALFVGRKTFVRMLGLWQLTHNQHTMEDCMVSLMQELEPPSLAAWHRPVMHYDYVGRWVKHQCVKDANAVLHWVDNCPVTSFDSAYVHDQYVPSKAGENRNFTLVHNLLEHRQQFLFEITFETMTEGLVFTPSEKTVRCIMSEKPQFVYAAPGFLRRLRELGFRTWHDCWDESYDTLSGPARFNAMFDTIFAIAQMPTEQKVKLHQAAAQHCAHNKAVLLDYIAKAHK